jgi:hypothetical protein
MPVPATTGQERNSILNMEVGDYIKFSAIRQSTSHSRTIFGYNNGYSSEIPVNGVSTTNGGYFYMIKVDKGLLIADRVVFHSYSWDEMNNDKVIQGNGRFFNQPSDVNGILRSLTGGVAYADANGNKSTTDQGTGLTFPTINEFDKYILGFDQTKIQSGKTLADVFHHDVIKTWTQDTPIISIAASTNRVARGGTTGTNNFSYLSSSTANTTVGFRPVFEYQE